MFHVALVLPMLALLAKLHKWTEAAMFFDGTGIGQSLFPLPLFEKDEHCADCVALHTAIIIIYLTIHIQSLRTFRKFPSLLPHTLHLSADELCSRNQVPQDSAVPTYSILPVPPPRETPITEDERTEAVRVLAAGNALIGILALGIIGMQVGQGWASTQEDKEQREIDNRAKKAAVEAKKDL